MSRKKIIEILCEYYGYSEEELANKTTDQLNDLLLEEREDSNPNLYPNDRDFDAEDEECF